MTLLPPLIYRPYDVLSSPITTASGIAFREKLDPGVFARSLAHIERGDQDCICTFNHDVSKFLGRCSSGTLSLKDSPTGLDFACKLDSNNSEHRNLWSSVRRQDISECSFGFLVDKEGDPFSIANDGTTIRTIHAAKLVDVSAVTHPAYNQGTKVIVHSRSVYSAGSRAAALTCAKRVLNPDVDARNRKRAAEIGEQIRQDILRAQEEDRIIREKADRIMDTIRRAEFQEHRHFRAVYSPGRALPVRFEIDFEAEAEEQRELAESIKYNPMLADWQCSKMKCWCCVI